MSGPNLLPGLGGPPPIPDERLWHGQRPRKAPARTLAHIDTRKVVDWPVYVLDEANFERAEQAIALCMAAGWMKPGRD